ncbi:MAG: DUF6587 family protein [Pseudomonadota bacterium]
MIQNLAVALIVALAALHACSRYLPAAWRQRIVYVLTRGNARQSFMAKWFRTEASCGSGCETCKACAEPAAPTGQRVIKIHTRK